MSTEISIGKAEGGGSVKLDIARLVVSRLLLTAASGGGKSWLLRKILEGASKTTQTIVIDTEGEFATLREKRDMVLAGPGGEVPAEPRSASLLCRRLMELNLSAVIDVSDLARPDKRRFLASFIDTLVDLPRTLWRPCVIAVDETHEYAEEGEKSESGKALSLLASKGRKRGYCLLGATQRLQKLDKDVAAELKNRFIGQMSLDVDLKRAADMLGFGKDRWPEIRDLSPPKHEGEFFGFGPALQQRGVIKFRAGPVETTHPKAGQGRLAEPPSPSAKIRGVLSELKDLPQQAEAEIKDLAAAAQKIAALERELKAATSTPKGAPKPEELRQAAARAKRDNLTIDQLRKGLEQAMKVLAEINAKGFDATGVDPEEVKKAVQAAADMIVKSAQTKIARQQAEFDRLKKEMTKTLAQMQKLLGDTDLSVRVDVQHNEPFTAAPVVSRKAPKAPREPVEGITPRQQRFLDAAAALAALGVEVNRKTVCAWVGVHPRGGSVGEELKALSDGGFILYDDGDITVTEAGMAAAGELDPGQAIERAKSGLSPRQKNFFDVIVAAYPESATREAIAEQFGIHPRGGSLGEDLGALVGRGLVEGRKGQYRARDFLFAGVPA